jgi:hypothetical protein
MTATMNTTPATIPTQAATTLSLPCRRRVSTPCVSTTVGVVEVVVVGVVGVSIGPVAGSGEDVDSVMFPIMAAVVMRQS